MNKEDMIYDQLKEIRSDVKDIKATTDVNSVVLEQHQLASERNGERLTILEKKAIIVNWRTVAAIVSIVGGVLGIIKGLAWLVTS